MARHFIRERELHERVAAALAPAMGEVEVLEVELDEPHELLRVFIDRPGGVGLEHCETATRVLDEAGITEEYGLEMSSPGIERPLRAPDHFRAVVGERVRLRRADHHRASVVTVSEIDDDAGVTFRREDGASFTVPFAQIVRCKLVVDDPFAAASRNAPKSDREGPA